MERAKNGKQGRIKRSVTTILAIAALSLGAAGYQERRPLNSSGTGASERKADRATAQRDDAGSRQAFLAAYKVFMHPRCMNCHPAGDVPLQGEDSHLHGQNVKRGPDGKGKYALKCANCHQLTNLPGENMPPGSPNWHLPPPETPMVFQGKTPGELARQLKDPKQNGGKTLEDILHHVSEDKLVLSGWNPGDGRAKPPLTHEEFAAKMREWVEKGAAAPE
jgi:mono/diheme cytochrome c family protein